MFLPGDKALARIQTCLREIEAGPSSADLAHAPVLNSWIVVQSDPIFCSFIGLVSDHPIIAKECAPVTTSPIMAINLEKNWARTMSRWYVLGEPADPNSQSKMANFARLAKMHIVPNPSAAVNLSRNIVENELIHAMLPSKLRTLIRRFR